MALTNQSLLKARDFLNRHRSEPEVSRTFGYFTEHPVAPLNRKRLELLLEQIQKQSARLKRPLRVLDLACGGGLISGAIAALGHSVLGMDLSHEEIQLARLFNEEEKLPALFAQCDLINQPDWENQAEELLGGKPDTIVLAYALHHFPRVEFLIERLSCWLPAGAVLLINEENPGSPLFRAKHIVRGFLQGDTDAENHRSFAAWKFLLQSNGFQVASVQGADILPGLDRLLPSRCWSLVFTASRDNSVCPEKRLSSPQQTPTHRPRPGESG